MKIFLEFIFFFQIVILTSQPAIDVYQKNEEPNEEAVQMISRHRWFKTSCIIECPYTCYRPSG